MLKLGAFVERMCPVSYLVYNWVLTRSHAQREAQSSRSVQAIWQTMWQPQELLSFHLRILFVDFNRIELTTLFISTQGNLGFLLGCSPPLLMIFAQSFDLEYISYCHIMPTKILRCLFPFFTTFVSSGPQHSTQVGASAYSIARIMECAAQIVEMLLASKICP